MGLSTAWCAAISGTRNSLNYNIYLNVQHFLRPQNASDARISAADVALLSLQASAMSGQQAKNSLALDGAAGSNMGLPYCLAHITHLASICMKTTIEIAAPLMRAAKALAQREHTTLRAVLERALRMLLDQPGANKPFKLNDVSVGGKGLQPGVSDKSWDEIRALSYGSRGGS
jgi:hypothetical protein